MKRLMSIVTLVLALPGLVSADDPTVVYFTRPTPIPINSDVRGNYELYVVGCGQFDESSLSLEHDGVDFATVFADGIASISSGSVASSFFANVATAAPQESSTISGSLSAESTTDANIGDDPCFSDWNAGPHIARADFNETFTIDGEVPGTPVTVFYTVNILAEVEVGVEGDSPNISLTSVLFGPGFDGRVWPSGLIQYNEGNDPPTVVDIEDSITENSGTRTVSVTFNFRYDSFVVGDTFSISNHTNASSFGWGEGSGHSRGTATVDWEATVVAQP